MRKWSHCGLVLLLSWLTVVSGCATAPVTGRNQLILISPVQEKAMGLSEYEKIKKKAPISHDPVATAMLNGVGWRIAGAASRPDYQWEFNLIDDNGTVNAFCLPGGKVFVYSGILKLTRDEAGLAVVVGHEVAHALARHGAERLSIALVAQVGEAAVEAAIGSASPAARQATEQAFGIATNLGVILPYSRTQEYEADRIGLILMARAGYDPRAAVEFWERMSAYSSRRPSPPAFLSTHPTDQARIERIKAFMGQALAEYHAAVTRGGGGRQVEE